jgi:hypothetical protein
LFRAFTKNILLLCNLKLSVKHRNNLELVN